MPRVLIAAAAPDRLRSMAAALAADPAVTLMGTATGGRQAVHDTIRRRPDVVVMEVGLDDVDGYEAARRIMASAPCPIVLTTVHPVSPEETAHAIEAGALAVVDFEPGLGPVASRRQQSHLLETVTLMAQVPVITRRHPDLRREAEDALPKDRSPKVVGIAASAGGPDALATVLPALPADFPAAVLLVQHIGSGFEEDLRSWLDTLTPLQVRIATSGESLRPGQVLLSPGDLHLKVSGDGLVHLDHAPPVGGHRPSADLLFRSLAESYGPDAVGVILTGMGHDGVDGLVALKRTGGHVIAQEETSCMVYGMPKEAVAAGVVDQILALPDIAAAVDRLARTAPADETARSVSRAGPPEAALRPPLGTPSSGAETGQRRSER